ncbi:MAG: glycosyltransferase family 4 protein [Flexilinea sp.]
MEPNLKILLICLTRRGGLLHFHDCLAESLSKLCTVGMITAENAEHTGEVHSNPAIQFFPLNTGVGKKGTILQLFNPLTWIRITRAVHTFQPDIVHITSAQEWNPLLGFFIRFLLRKPLVYTIHDVVYHEGTPKYFRITETIFRKIPRFFVVLTNQGKDVLISKGILPERILVVPHGIYDFFTQCSDDAIEPENEILFFGRIEAYKGLDILLKAMPAVLRKHPDWRLHIAGGGEIKPYRQYLTDERILLTNRFVTDEEVAVFMQRASIVALPYLSASQSGVIPTAFAFHKAVIATNVGGIPDIIQDHQTGLLIPPNDVQALTKAILNLIEHPVLREKIGEKGFIFANENLGWTAIAKKHLSFYRQIISS